MVMTARRLGDPESHPGHDGGSILVGVNGTSSSDAALAWALQEARVRGTGVEALVTRSAQVAAVEHVTYDELTEQRCEHLLHEAIERVGGAGNVPIRLEVRDDGPFFQLKLEAVARRASLSVIGTHADGRIHHALAGAHAASITRHARSPVVLVPSGFTRPSPERLVVGVDGSMAGLQALSWAVREAALTGAAVRAVEMARTDACSAAEARGARSGLERVIELSAGSGVEITVAGHKPESPLGDLGPSDLAVIGMPAPRHLVGSLATGEVRSCLHSGRPVVLVQAPT